MKVSYNWLQALVDFDLPPVDELVEKIGAQLGGVEEVINVGERYKGIVVVKVVGCKPIEGSDHLNLCRIDDGKVVKDVERGDDGLVQVVCGAPNCREGLMVAWLPPGSTVPSSIDDEEPFVLTARELRGHVSNGMLASPKELALFDSHEGILELDVIVESEKIKADASHAEAIHNYIDNPNIKPGDDFANAYKLADEQIIEIENKMFTHRPDCFGMLGVAREVAGILGKPFKSPDIYKVAKRLGSADVDGLEVRNELPELVPRFVAQRFDGVHIGPSPVWMQTYLSRVGIRPINNVVDITNYFMVLTGQPLHAYDYDKVKALSDGDKAVIVVRNPHQGEKITLLGGKVVEPRSEAIMIATDKQAIGIGGVMGGAETEVDENTQNIILECATFDMYSIRRTSMEHGLFTDAVTRFTKGQSPLQNDRVVAWAADQLICDAGALPGGVIDINNMSEGLVKRASLHPAVTVSADFINQRLGSKLSPDDIKKLLENVEFSVETKDDEITVTGPFWRTDIELREDIVEEVGRLYGYDNLPLQLPRRDITPASRNVQLDTKNEIRDSLSRAGANEVLTYSFVHADLFTKVGQDASKAFELSNALSPELQHYRLSLTPSLLEKVHPNIKAGYDQFALFELGRSHFVGEWDESESGVPNEDHHLALVVAYSDKARPQDSAYYLARKYLEQVSDVLGHALVPMTSFDLESDEWGKQLAAPYEPNRSALIVRDNMVWGVVGEFKPGVRRALKLPNYASGFEIHLDVLTAAAPHYEPLSRFPKVTQDLTLKVDAKVNFSQLEKLLMQTCEKLGQDPIHISYQPLMIFQPQDAKDHHNVSFRLSFVNYERTMTDKEVNGLIDEIAIAAKELKAERV